MSGSEHARFFSERKQKPRAQTHNSCSIRLGFEMYFLAFKAKRFQGPLKFEQQYVGGV